MQEKDIQEQLNKVWNGWKIDKLLGEGSFGKVYRIEKEEFGHVYDAALKVITIPPSQSEVKSVMDEGMDERSVTSYFYSIVEDIVEEFTLMSKLKGNTNIVSYEDHAVVPMEDGVGWNIYIRMELLSSLLDYLRTKPLSIRDVINLGIDICNALEICQKYSIIHRDIKPENIFVSDLGKYKLGDFGIARQLEKTTGNLSRKGTFNYMAPEVYKGEEYTSSVDIYSLGIVLYRFLNNNRVPFLPPYPTPLRYSDKEEANAKRMTGVPMSPPCNASGRLAEIVLKACAYKPSDRYATAVDMKNDLMAVLYDARNATYTDGAESKNALNVNSVKDKEYTKNPQKKTGMDNDATVYMKNDDTTGEKKKKQESDHQKEIAKRREQARQRELQAQKEQEYQRELQVQKQQKKETESQKAQVGVKQAQQNVKSSKRKTGLVIAAMVGVSVVGVAGVVGVNIYKKPQTREIPNVMNLTLDNAIKMAAGEDEFFTITTSGEEYSYTVEEGHVISQSIEPGTVASKGEQIQVVVSSGIVVNVPNVAGVEVATAQNQIEAVGLTYAVEQEIYSDDVAAGVIISQNVEAGSTAEEGSTVAVVVSKGKEQVEVPNVTGIAFQEAKALLDSLGLTYNNSKEYTDTVAKGDIISQSVEAGSLVDKGAEIALVTSEGVKEKPVINTPVRSTQKATTQSKGSSKKKKESADSIDSWDLVN